MRGSLPGHGKHVLMAAAAAALVMSVGCASRDGDAVDLGTHTAAADLVGRVVTSEPILVFPDRHWVVDEATGGWSFRTTADLVAVVRQPLQEPLRFRLVPDEQTSRLHFTVDWDHEPLIAGPGQPSAEGSELTVPSKLAFAGVHRLTVTRVYGADAVADRDLYDNRFVALEYVHGRHHVTLEGDRRGRDEYLDWFFTLGATGAGIQKLSGVLFDGPHEARVTLEDPSAGRLSFRVENHSTAQARFSLDVDGSADVVEVEPDQQAELTAPLVQGRSEVIMRVEGARSGLFLWGAPFSVATTKPAPDTIVLISLDTTRRDALTPYGAPAGDTPNLQRLADGATVFDAAYAAAPWTLPSHASMFTGLYPSHHGAGVADDHLRLDRTTLADLLGQAGYFTVGFAGGELCASRWGLAQGFMEYRDPEGFETRGDHLTDAVAARLAERHADPLFVFVNYFDPHALYRAPPRFRRRFRVDELSRPLVQLPVWGDLVRGEGDALQRVIDGEAQVTPQALTYLKAAYRAEVAFMDQQIGRLLDALKAADRFDASLIIVVADHGELLGEGGYFTHGCRLAPELVEVPMIVKWPHQREGHRVGDLVSQVDILPTVLEAAGLSVPGGDGLGLPRMSGGRTEDRLVLMEEHESRIHPLFKHMMVARHLFGLQMLRSREVVWQGGIECSRLAGSSWLETPCSGTWRDREPLVRKLITASESGDDSSPGHLSDEERRRLEALGYVH